MTSLGPRAKLSSNEGTELFNSSPAPQEGPTPERAKFLKEAQLFNRVQLLKEANSPLIPFNQLTPLVRLTLEESTKECTGECSGEYTGECTREYRREYTRVYRRVHMKVCRRLHRRACPCLSFTFGY
jgi:hypothetical protein